jgi:Putative MetA-pathway of phenol degradation
MKLFNKSAFIGLLCFAINAKAQMPNDAVYMPKNTICVVAAYGSSSWKEYWENTLKRENFNIGTHTTNSYTFMAAAGITDKLSVFVGLPYMTTNASAGNLLGQKGIQDFSASLKYKLVEKNGLSLHAGIGGSIPVGNYVPDFLPMSIGLQAKTFSGRFIASYQHKSGIYLTGNANYILRSTITVDRDAYQADNRVYNSNTVNVPNATETGLALGFLKNGLQTELNVGRFTCVGGDNIRRNDMPFPTNNMQATSVGFFGKYQPKNFGVMARASYVIDGLNVGQSSSYMVGVAYLFSPPTPRGGVK